MPQEAGRAPWPSSPHKAAAKGPGRGVPVDVLEAQRHVQGGAAHLRGGCEAARWTPKRVSYQPCCPALSSVRTGADLHRKASSSGNAAGALTPAPRSTT